MKTINVLLHKIRPIQQSIWLTPALTAVALIVAVLGVTGCNPPHH